MQKLSKMKIKTIKLTNFRNYKNTVINFEDGVNFIVGDNAQGKTNLLESVYFCAMGKSFKNIKEKLLINYDSEYSNLDLDFSTLAGNKNITTILSKNSKKTVKINKIPISKLTQLIGTLNVVLFSPDELKLVKEVPEDRRKFLDISISQFDKSYMYDLIRYEQILKQRNCVFKTFQSRENKIEQLKIWTPQLIDVAEKIIKKRIVFINKLNNIAKKIHKTIKNAENLTILYSFNNEIEKIKDYLTNLFNTNLEKELDLQHTLIGPHRDDIIFKINDKDCKYFASQGQQRTVALSLKLALMEIIYEYNKEYPVLLLDDVLSELDIDRQLKLLELTSKYQTLITTTSILSQFKNYNSIFICNGNKL